jgi:hypothetical protein
MGHDKGTEKVVGSKSDTQKKAFPTTSSVPLPC